MTGEGRRLFLKLLPAAGAALAVAGGSVLFDYAPWLDYDTPARESRKTFDTGSLLDVVRYATLAASSHNTQPWKFALEANALALIPDFGRSLPVVDPDHREFWISLGCALENLLISARAAGHRPEVSFPEASNEIRVELTADAKQPGPLFDAIPLRQNTRSTYDGKPVNTAGLDALHSMAVEPGITLHFVSRMDTVADSVRQAAISQYSNKAFMQELTSWLRFNKKEALNSLDGLYAPCAGSPPAPRWLGRMFLNGTKPQTQAEADCAKLRSSSGAVVIASALDDKAAWIGTGQVYQRLALTMTSLGIKCAFLNQPMEVPAVRDQFATALGLGSARPQLLVRFGYADRMPYSLRRPADQVMKGSTI